MDEVDKKIIAQLQEDGRTSLEELSKITGFTSMGTKKRLDKLIENRYNQNICSDQPKRTWTSPRNRDAGNGKC